MPEPYRQPAKAVDDPVTSIRVASTLLERFRVLLATGSSSTEGLELAIGEAQQIYPEIWRHLDDARRMLVARERDVAPYDELRTMLGQRLGVTDVEAYTKLDTTALLFGRIRVEQVKTATFNVAGYQLATSAAKALQGAMPEVDFAALARAEAKEIAAAGSLHGAKWLGIVKWVGIAAAIVVVVLIAVKLLSRRDSFSDDDPPSPRAGHEGLSTELQQLRDKLDKIDLLKKEYAATCNHKLVPEITGLLRSENREQEARKLETTPCVPITPSCDGLRDAMTERLVKQFNARKNPRAELRCKGMVAGKPGALVPALAVGFSATAKDGEPIEMRAILTPDGLGELVPFAASPEDAVLIGIADLDGDSVDELVMAGDKGFLVSKLDGGALTDILGPTLSCFAVFNVERDLREQKDGTKKLVLEVPADAPKQKGCPPPGRHYYTLAAGKLVEQ